MQVSSVFTPMNWNDHDRDDRRRRPQHRHGHFENKYHWDGWHYGWRRHRDWCWDD